MAIFFIPIALLAPTLYRWMQVADPHADHALHAKLPLFTKPGFYLVRAGLLRASGGGCRMRLRTLSLEQDKDGAARMHLQDAARRLPSASSCSPSR